VLNRNYLAFGRAVSSELNLDTEPPYGGFGVYLRFFKHKATIPVIKDNRAISSIQVTIGITTLAGSEQTAKRDNSY
jgi:hypothetical protein